MAPSLLVSGPSPQICRRFSCMCVYVFVHVPCVMLCASLHPFMHGP